MMNRRAFMLGAPAAVAACSGTSVWAPDDMVQRAIYRHDGPPMLMLFTMKTVRSGGGAHLSMMINASQRVIFDPAGSFKHHTIPERNDVIFGVTPQILDVYIDFHSRETFYCQTSALVVPAAVAEEALVKAMNYGAVAPAFCTKSTTTILRSLPGFEDMPDTFFPNKAQAHFDTYPGVVINEYRDDDPDDNSDFFRKKKRLEQQG